MNVVITGASRGIGSELCRQALQRGDHVLAIARDPNGSSDLKALGSEHPRLLSRVGVDLTSPTAMPTIAGALESWPHVDVLFNSAGVLMEDESTEAFLRSFHINSVVPFLTTRTLLPWLKRSADPKIAHLTSLMGSIEDNSSGGYYAYRASKAALNMIHRSLSRDHRELTSVVLHPGWVKTDMGGANAPIRPEESARGLWNLVHGLKREDSGKFFDFRGRPLPW